MMIRDSDGKNRMQLGQQLCKYYGDRSHEDKGNLPRVTEKNVLTLKYYSFENYFLFPEVMAQIGVVKSVDAFYDILWSKYQEYLYKLTSVKAMLKKTGIKLQSRQDIVDNIACDGQCVCIPRGRYSKISLIGSAEFGNSSDILRLQDQGKAAGEITIAFTDYINPPQCGESVAWQGHGVVKENGDWQEMKEVLYLYQQEYDMPAGEVSEILLPINPSIHIFAITIV